MEYNNKNTNFYEHEKFQYWNVEYIINYIKNHYIQFLLLIIVCVIVYVIDHISNINAVIYGAPQIIPGVNNKPNEKMPIKKRNKSKK